MDVTADLEQRFKRLKEKVLVKRPVLKDILERHGHQTLLDYAIDYVDVNLNPPIVKRQNELLSTVHELMEGRFGKKTADEIVAQMEKYYFVSTADHIGPIVHPFFINSNLLTALAIQEEGDPILKYIIVLGCANISVDNSSFPRGLFYHTAQNGELLTHRLPFFSSNERPASIYKMHAYGKEELGKMYHALDTDLQKKTITQEMHKRITNLIGEIYDQPDILACANYAEQVSKTNRKLWEKFFEASNTNLPDLMYLELEDIVVKLITKYHLSQDTIIQHVLFDPKYESYINEYFEGIFGSFSRENEAGTYLFWALPEGARHNIQLWREGNHLVSSDGSYKIELTPDAIRDAMERKELIPNLLLCFMVVSFYYGLKCIGGFNQVNYLTLMKNAYIKMNVDLGNYRSIEVCARAQTKELSDGLTFSFLEYQNGKDTMALASGLDLILYGHHQSWETLRTICKKMTLEEAINPLIPEIYRITYDEAEWEPDLITITEKDANKIAGLDHLPACISLSSLPKEKA